MVGGRISLKSALCGALFVFAGLAAACPAWAEATGGGEKSVLMVLWRGDTEAEIAFKSRLAELGIKARYTEIVGDQNRGILAQRMRAIEDDIAAKKYDAVYTSSTPSTQIAELVVKDRIPIVFNIVFDPVGGKLVQTMQAPGVNVTGVTNGVPVADQLDIFLGLTPIKKLVVLFNPREANSNIIERQARAWAQARGKTIETIRVAPGGSLDAVIDDLRSGKIEADAVYAGADSFLATKAAVIKAAIGDKVHLFGGTETFVQRGWLGTYAPTVLDMGNAAADSLARILAGADARSMPVLLPTPKLILSEAAAHLDRNIAASDGPSRAVTAR